jgi:DNA-directed RNA polymerase sigma subunit (sigma70/sigma32)
MDRPRSSHDWLVRSVLDERERAVIRAHYGLGGQAQTLDQIGGALGRTAERARQIEVGALNKLREALAQPVISLRQLAAAP